MPSLSMCPVSDVECQFLLSQGWFGVTDDGLLANRELSAHIRRDKSCGRQIGEGHKGDREVAGSMEAGQLGI